MAEKRMFSRSVVSSDPFLDMPKDAQCLYFQLNLAADDRGICDCPRRVMRSCGASDDSMRLLIAKKFVLIPKCNDQVVVIKHWRINNNMRTQRFKETKHINVLAELFYDENKSYSQNPGDGHVPCLAVPDEDLLPSGRPMVNQWSTNGLPSADQRSTQNRTEQSRVDKSRVDEYREEENTIPSTSTERKEEEGEYEGEQPPPAAPVSLSPEERREKIEYHRFKIDSFRKRGWHVPDFLYDEAAAEGITREELDGP